MTTLAARIVEAMRTKGLRLDVEPGQVNIIYVEGMNPDGTANPNTPNHFDDLRITLSFVAGVPKIVSAWEGTTEPGRRYTEQPINPKGAARIALGQHHAWQVGMHRGNHEALVQTGGHVAVCRDANRDYKRDGDKIDIGDFGINQHGGYDNPLDDIKTASAGCIVGRTMEGHREFMRIVKSDPRYLADHGFVFSATILTAAEVLGAAGAIAAPPLQPQPAISADQRRRMAKAIIDFEARRDKQGRLAVYALPAGDGGGSYEVAGINDRYHPQQAAKLKALIEQGRYEDAEASVAEYIGQYTDVVATWSGNAGVQFDLRDCSFNRGPTGAARIFQRALGDVAEDGIAGRLTLASAAQVAPADLLQRLRQAREAYERHPVGRDETSVFWRGLVNRWNNVLTIAQRFAAEAPPTPVPAAADPHTDPVTSDPLLAILAAAFALLKEWTTMTDKTTSAPASGAIDPRQTIAAARQILADVRQLAADVKPLLDLWAAVQRMARGQPAAAVDSIAETAAVSAPPPVMSTIDKVVGGEFMTGRKTMTGLLGLVVSLVGSKVGVPGLDGVVGEVLPYLFGGLTGVGTIAKIDRGLKIAGGVLGALRKIATPPAA